MRDMWAIGLGVVLAVALAGCGKKQELGPGAGDQSVPVEKPKSTFSWIQENILNPKCVECHNSKKAKGEVNLSSYEALMESGVVEKSDPASSMLFLAIDSGDMPFKRGKLSQEHIDIIKKWIEEGAKPL